MVRKTTQEVISAIQMKDGDGFRHISEYGPTAK